MCLQASIPSCVFVLELSHQFVLLVDNTTGRDIHRFGSHYSLPNPLARLASEAAKTPRSVMSPVTKRAGVTSKA